MYTFAGVLKDVGGIFNSLYFLGLIFYSQFQGSMYLASIINKLYLVDGEADD